MKKYFIFTFLAIFSQKAFSQGAKKTTVQPLTDTSLYASHMSSTPVKSSLSYSALSQFVQSSVTTGTNGGFNFKSSFFGLHQLFSKGNDSLSSYYLPHTAGRNTELSLGINKANTTSDQLSRITAGFKYAPINNRDKSYHNFAVEGNLLKDIQAANHALLYAKIVYGTRYIINKILGDNIKQSDQLSTVLARASQLTEQKLKQDNPHIWTQNDLDGLLTGLDINAAVTKTINDAFASAYPALIQNSKAYADTSGKAKVDASFKQIADSVYKADLHDVYSVYYKAMQKRFNDLAKKIDMGALLTFSINPGYNIQKKHWDTTTFAVRFLQGFGKNVDKPWNIDFQFMAVSLQDSTATKQNFGHNKLEFSLGVDKVFARDDKDNPLLEAELAGEYDNVVSGKFAHEDKHTVTANLVTSIHLSKEFTLPLTLKYDPKHANLLGLLSVQWNLEDSGKSGAKKN